MNVVNSTSGVNVLLVKQRLDVDIKQKPQPNVCYHSRNITITLGRTVLFKSTYQFI